MTHIFLLTRRLTPKISQPSPMEERPAAGAASVSRFRHQRSPPSANRYLGVLPQQSNPPSTMLELSEDDIFSTPSGSSSPSPIRQYIYPNTSPVRSLNCNHYGILAALNANLKARSRSSSGIDIIRPVFNHKTSASASISSSSSASPPATTSSRVMIPRPPRARFYHQSAPVNVPVMPAELQRRIRDLEEVGTEEAAEDEEEEDGVIKPPHEVVASRHSPMLACSVLEGAGRTLKGRDLKQVRNAIWQKTGFID